jgi:hypothetical protein
MSVPALGGCFDALGHGLLGLPEALTKLGSLPDDCGGG